MTDHYIVSKRSMFMFAILYPFVSGQYSCQLSITNGTSTISDSASLEIATLADTFLTSPESKSPMVGEDSVYLFCSYGNSHPPANISWLKNSQLDSSLTFTTTTLIVGGVPVSSR